MKKSVLIFSSKFDIINRVLRLGYNPILIHENNPENVSDYIHLTLEDAKNCNCNLNLFEPFLRKNVVGVAVGHEYPVELAEKVRRLYFCNLKGLTESQLEKIRNKLAFKENLKCYDIPTTKFSPLNLQKKDIVSIVGHPFLIKPKKEGAARGITLIQSDDDWSRWLNKGYCLDDCYAEEYLTDIKEYCCDTIVADGKILAQFPGEYTVTCLESNWKHDGIGVNFPGFLPKEKIGELKSLARRFVEKHGIKNGFCHMEFFYTKEGWKFGEIGWRLPGGYQLPTESYIAGINLLDLYLKIFIETEPTPQDPLDVENKYYGYYLYPKKAGRVVKIKQDLNYPWIVESKIYVQEGQNVPFEDSSVAMGAHIVYKANSIEELKHYSDLAPHLIAIDFAVDGDHK